MNLQNSNEKRTLNHSDIENVHIKINLAKEKETKKDLVRAYAIVTFFGCLVVKGYRIWQSPSRGFYATPPATPFGGKYVEIIFMENKILWKKLEEKLIETYQNKEMLKEYPETL